MSCLTLLILGALLGSMVSGFAVAAFALGGRSDDYDELQGLRAYKRAAEGARRGLSAILFPTHSGDRDWSECVNATEDLAANSVETVISLKGAGAGLVPEPTTNT